jgi:hypothetical protein
VSPAKVAHRDDCKAAWGECAGQCLGTPDVPRCNRCGWPLKATIEEGCTEGNCSQRPLPPICESASSPASDKAIYAPVCETCGGVDLSRSACNAQSAEHGAAAHVADWLGIDARAGNRRGPHDVKVVRFVRDAGGAR